MDLRRKLARLDDAGPGSRPVPSDPDAARRSRIEQLRALIRRTALAHPASAERGPYAGAPLLPPLDSAPSLGTRPDALLPGEDRVTAHGRVRVIERWLEPHHCHGRVRVADALGVCSTAVAQLALDPVLERVDPRRMLFVDTETTGLAGGAGTLPFLIGFAWFEDQSLCVRQLFLRRPGEEAPMLHLFAERLRAASCLVSFNGKSFDWPLLRTRFVLNRVPMPETPPHLDLLHCARRVLDRRLPSMRLVRIEREVLGMHREDDVDGADIPGLYLRWLRRGEASPLAPVIEHNANDLVALAAVLARLAAHYATLQPRDDPRDHLGYARVAFRASDPDRAERFALAAADGGADPCVTVDALLLAARVARRARDVASEERALLRALDVGERAARDRLPRIHLLLAKLCEHRLRAPERALGHARHTELAEPPAAHARRIARLERRIERRIHAAVTKAAGATPPRSRARAR